MVRYCPVCRGNYPVHERYAEADKCARCLEPFPALLPPVEPPSRCSSC